MLVEAGRVALIRRQRDGNEYFLFLGGGVEGDETDEVAAAREALEELGLVVEVGRLLGTARGARVPQSYFEATTVGGDFGTGTGAEMTSTTPTSAGSYEAVWLPLEELPAHDVRPWDLAELLAEGRTIDESVDFVG